MDRQIWGCLITSRQCRCLVNWLPWKPEVCRIKVQQLCRLLVLTSSHSSFLKFRSTSLNLQTFSVTTVECSELLVAVISAPGQTDLDVSVRAAQIAHSFRALHSGELSAIALQDAAAVQKSMAEYTARDVSSEAEEGEPRTLAMFASFQETSLPAILRGPVCSQAWLVPFAGIPSVQSVLLVEVQHDEAVLLRSWCGPSSLELSPSGIPPAWLAAGPHVRSVWQAIQEACIRLVLQKASRRKARVAALRSNSLSISQLPSSPQALRKSLSSAAGSGEREATLTIHFHEYTPALVATVKLLCLPGSCCCMVVFFQPHGQQLSLGVEAGGVPSPPTMQAVSSRTGGLAVPLGVRAAIKAASKCFKLAFPKPLELPLGSAKTRGPALAVPEDALLSEDGNGPTRAAASAWASRSPQLVPADLPGSVEPQEEPASKRPLLVTRLSLAGLLNPALGGGSMVTPSSVQPGFDTPRAGAPHAEGAGTPMTASRDTAPHPLPLTSRVSRVPEAASVSSLAGTQAACGKEGPVGPPTPQPHPPQSPRPISDAPQLSPRRPRSVSGTDPIPSVPPPLSAAGPPPLGLSPAGGRLDQSRDPPISPRRLSLQRTASVPIQNSGSRRPETSPVPVPRPPSLPRQATAPLSPRIMSARASASAPGEPFSFPVLPAALPRSQSGPDRPSLSPRPSPYASPRRPDSVGGARHPSGGVPPGSPRRSTPPLRTSVSLNLRAPSASPRRVSAPSPRVPPLRRVSQGDVSVEKLGASASSVKTSVFSDQKRGSMNAERVLSDGKQDLV